MVAMVCLALAGCSSPKTHTGADSRPGAQTAYKTGLPLPKAETALVEAVYAASQRYRTASSASSRSGVRADRAKALKAVLAGNHSFKGWIGKLADLSTTAEGEAFVRVDMPGTRISVGTWEDPASDKRDHTLIPRHSRLYKRLTDLGIGTLVTVSGRFVPSGDDFIAESSLNEAGTMKTPTFIARIDDIRPYKAPRR
jgi:hypothetical protein